MANLLALYIAVITGSILTIALIVSTYKQLMTNAIQNEKNFLNSRYRIYVNNDLIVERNWLFDNNIFLRESLWLNCILKEYTLKIEPIVFNLNQIKFFIKNPKVNNKSIDFNPDQLELSFTI